MKLRNKKTGDIGVLNRSVSNNKYYVIVCGLPLCGNSVLGEYDTLDALVQEWEDYEEPKGIQDVYNVKNSVYIEMGSKEEAEEAVEKLKAWKRLKDKGFRFEGWGTGGEYGSTITFSDDIEYNDETIADLDLLFRGEK
jgi:hypothetical protein